MYKLLLTKRHVSLFLLLGILLLALVSSGQNTPSNQIPKEEDLQEEFCIELRRQVELANDYYVRGSDGNDSAKKIVDELLAKLENVNKNELDSSCIMDIALIFQVKGSAEYRLQYPDYLDSCIWWYDEGLNLITPYIGDGNLRSAKLYMAKGSIYSNHGQNGLALTNYQEAVLDLEQISNPSQEILRVLGRAYNNLGAQYFNQLEYISALPLFQKADSIFQTLPDSFDIDTRADLLSSLGTTHNNLGEYGLGSTYIHRSHELLKKNLPDYQLNFSRSFIALGRLKGQEFDVDLAIQYFQQALSNKELDHISKGEAYSGLGVTADMMEEHEKSLMYFQLADSFLIVDVWLRAMNQIYIAAALNHVDRYDEALQLLEESLDFFKDVPYFLGVINLEKAIAYDSLKRTSQAQMYYEKAIDIFHKHLPEKNPQVTNGFLLTGLHHYNQGEGNFDSALSYFQQALQANFHTFKEQDPRKNPTHLSANYRAFVPSLFGAKGLSWESIYDQDPTNWQALFHAHQTYSMGIKMLDSIKAQVSSGYLVSFYNKYSIENYEGIQSTFLHLGELSPRDQEALVSYMNTQESNPNTDIDFSSSQDLSFRYCQKAKSSSLQTYLNSQSAYTISGVPPSLSKKESQLKQQISRLEGGILGAEGDLLKQLQEKMTQALFSLDSLMEVFKKDHPDYHRLKYLQPTVSLRELQSVLDDSTMVLEYFYGQTKISLYAISKDTFEIHSFELSTKLKEEIGGLKDMLASSLPESWEEDEYQRSSYEIYQKLVHPALNQEKINKLIVIPDGELSSIPFDILLSTSPDSTLDHNELPYLLNDYIIQNHFSIYLLHQDLQKEAHTSLTSLAYAPSYSLDPRATERGATHAALKFNQAEGEMVSEKTAGSVKKGSEATENNFREDFTQGKKKLFHFSGHAALDEENPLLSYLQFFQSKTEKSDSLYFEQVKDGKMYAYELLEQALDAEVAIFSACEVAGGSYGIGLGLQSFASFFRYSGCPTIVASLWKAGDESSKDLMELYYQELAKGYTTAEALTYAKRAFLKKKYQEPHKITHPKNWGNFVMIGLDQKVDFIPWWKRFLIPVLIGLALLTVVSAITLKNRGNKKFL